MFFICFDFAELQNKNREESSKQEKKTVKHTKELPKDRLFMFERH